MVGSPHTWNSELKNEVSSDLSQEPQEATIRRPCGDHEATMRRSQRLPNSSEMRFAIQKEVFIAIKCLYHCQERLRIVQLPDVVFLQ
ncbi:hypothetical protein PoB_000467800 [Plakobranchus ocellatus]|uniref:Uncharacterized protein n=1 Tax=Plakobranchus ocellatus TaxID=259542 RepID=A0AAV3Y7K6_9GAST|nr:hypothetical protein PoB_000467800 [Plakobranchus ocellatus]